MKGRFARKWLLQQAETRPQSESTLCEAISCDHVVTHCRQHALPHPPVGSTRFPPGHERSEVVSQLD